MKPITLLYCALLIASSAFAQDNYRVLPADFNADKVNQMMRSYQRGQVHAALDARLEEFEAALKSPEAIAAYQDKRRDFLAGVFGPLPKRGPLNARITKQIQRDRYTIEHVLFESLPGFHVTANLYRPPGKGPFPAVLLPCGHSANGKAYSSYQKASILLAQQGFVVLCFDPIGQGERRQLIGDQPHPIRRQGEHNPLGVAPILLGRSLAAMMVWDGMRGIDYLCSRPEVDPKRIGCTGNSGGGNLTSYLMAFDERIVAAAPGCFMTTHRRKNEFPGPGDAEQNLHGQIRDGFDHPDFILTRAPKPTLILSATHDYVPIAGAWEAFRQAKRMYTVLGHPERVELIETDDKHGFSKRLREGVARFMARWLQGRDVEVFEAEQVPILKDAELQVTPDGQVRWLPAANSVFDVYAETERQLAAKRPRLTTGIVRQATGIRPLAQLPPPKVEFVESTVLPKKLILHPEPGIVLPVLHWPGGDLRPILLAPGDGMNSTVAHAREWHGKGHPVAIVEVRDTGETKTRNWRFFGADSFIGQMLGRSWLTQRTEDLLISARWLSGSSKRVAIHASGECVPAALHAGYLEPELIADVQVKDGLTSWRELMTSRDAYQHIHQAVDGALRFYDLPDLAVAGRPKAILNLPGSGTDPEAIDFDQLPLLPGEHAIINEVAYSPGYTPDQKLLMTTMRLNLHNYLAHFDGRFWCIWSDGPKVEDWPTQEIKYSTSEDGMHWAPAKSVTGTPKEPYAFIARGLWIRDGQLLTLAAHYRGKGAFGANKELELRAYGWNAKAGQWEFVSKVYDNAINNFPPQKLADGNWIMTRRDARFNVTILIGGRDRIDEWDVVPVVRMGEVKGFRPDEPIIWPMPDHSLNALFRDNGGSRRLYYSRSTDLGRTWETPALSNFPNSTSKIYSIGTSRGYRVMISNSNTKWGRREMHLSVSPDGTHFTRMAKLDIPAPIAPEGFASIWTKFRKGIASLQYPHVIEHDEHLYIAFSRCKLQIAMFRVSLDDVDKLLKGAE